MGTVEFVRWNGTLPGVLAMYGYAADGLEEGLHRGIPSRGLTLILSLDAPVDCADTADAWHSGRLTAYPSLTAGLHTGPTFVHQPRRQRGIQLSIHPLAARALFGVPAAELQPATWRGDEVLGRGIADLRDRLHELDSWDARFRAVAEHLCTRLAAASRHRPRREVADAFARLALADGAVGVAELARGTCLSTRQLTVLTRRELGVTPRDLAGLMRFDAAMVALVSEVRAGRRPGLAGLAARTGYYDQAHLTREFRRYAGLPPGAFAAEEVANIQAGGHARGHTESHEHIGDIWDEP